MDWIPTLGDRSGPLYQRIVEALAEDIAGGRLHRGQQLPTHRALAKATDLDLTTVTRAYREARRRGLTEARVGQGTFVAEAASPIRRDTGARIAFDLSMNLPPQPVDADLEGRILRGLAALHREVGFAAYLNYRDSAGSEEERDVAAAWLRRRLPGLQGERVAICPGSQTALLCLLLALTSPGDVVVSDMLTYPGMRAAAAQAGVRLQGVPADSFGMLPDALDAACRAQLPKAVYLVPTIHNPTTVTMPPQRRAEIATVLRAHRIWLIEDDAYGALEPDAVPLAALVPELAWHAASLSKCITPGLRVSIAVAPDQAAVGRLAGVLRAAVQMPVGLTTALAIRWLGDGTADALIGAVRAEARARQAIASRALGGLDFQANRHGHHIWVPLPASWSRAEFAAHLQRQGLAVVTSEAFSVGEPVPHAIRVALGAAANRAELARALDILAAALRTSAVTARVV
jgi:DNA-binding transcriptional MocR family regulator